MQLGATNDTLTTDQKVADSTPARCAIRLRALWEFLMDDAFPVPFPVSKLCVNQLRIPDV